jgi:REP element-mobilizing transposase RayT
MAIPSRLKDELPGTFFVSANTTEKRFLLQSERMAMLFIDVLLRYRDDEKFAIHEFTVMPNHVHVLLTPNNSRVSAAVQSIKGGFSFKAGELFGFKGVVWQRGFSEHCIRDANDYETHRLYIWQNAVKANLVANPKDYPFCSANGKFKLDIEPKTFRG